MPKDLAIVLNSGSLNSAVATALAAQKYRPIMVLAELSAGPPTRRRAAFEQQVVSFKPYREHVVGLHFLSALQDAETAAALAADPRQGGMLGPQLRHLLPLVASAVSFASHYQAGAIYLGLRAGPAVDELAQATEYVQVLNELIQMPCSMPELELVTPLLDLEPWQVVDVGFQVAAPFEHAWSCYEEGGEPCGTCRGCRIRDAAFTQAGRPDPQRPPRRS
jgi:7-cyano-7-deazaguanine synthase in queuosine biosynthesis